MEDLERCLAKLPLDAGKLIVTDGVFSMSGDICNLPKIIELAKKYNAATMVDDAHGFGVLGNGGRGTADHFGLTEETDIIMSTFSKSLASLAALWRRTNILLNMSNKETHMRLNPPASCAAALAALRVIKKKPELVSRLTDLAVYMKRTQREGSIQSPYTPL